MGYVYFTDEQKQRANSVDLVDFLERQGEQLTRSGREWRWKRHDSVTVRGSEWFRHSRKEGGHAIDFVQEFYDMSFPEAVQWLLGGEGGMEWNQTDKCAPPPKKDFALPEVNPDMRRVFAYLIKRRFIDRDVLSHFAHEKLIYEDKEYAPGRRISGGIWRILTGGSALPTFGARKVNGGFASRILALPLTVSRLGCSWSLKWLPCCPSRNKLKILS